MESVLFFAAEHYPWWGIPLALIFGETANHFRRTGQRRRTVFCAFFALLFALLAGLYFYYNGFENLRSSYLQYERSTHP